MGKWYYTQIRKTMYSRWVYGKPSDVVIDMQGWVSEEIPPIVLGHKMKEAALNFDMMYGEKYYRVEHEIAYACEITEEEGNQIMALKQEMQDALAAKREAEKLATAIKASNDHANREHARKQTWWYQLFFGDTI